MALSIDDYGKAAARLGCDVAIVKAVAEVEAGRYGAFLPSGEPVILFERHKFRKLTGGRYDAAHPDLSHPKMGGYGPVAQQHTKLRRALVLDRDAALQSCSWGLFQVMGMNWKALGYTSLHEFVQAMYRSEADHLDAFIRFVERNGLAQHLKSKNWAAFAKAYNGPSFSVNQYDAKLQTAYEKYSRNLA